MDQAVKPYVNVDGFVIFDARCSPFPSVPASVRIYIGLVRRGLSSRGFGVIAPGVFPAPTRSNPATTGHRAARQTLSVGRFKPSDISLFHKPPTPYTTSPWLLALVYLKRSSAIDPGPSTTGSRSSGVLPSWSAQRRRARIYLSRRLGDDTCVDLNAPSRCKYL